MNQEKYIGMDVHQATISVAVRDSSGKLIMECILETKAATILEFIAGLRGTLSLTFEEGTSAAWLHDLLKPHVSYLVVCDPRRNALLKDGSKSDRIDAQKLAELLRGGLLKAVDHEDHGVRALKELVRNYECLVQDSTRTMSRLKAIYRGRAIACKGHEIYRQDQKAKWLGKLKERGVKVRAGYLYEQLAALHPLRQKAKVAMLREARRQAAYRCLMSVPRLGPISVAQLLAVVGSPHRFRSKRQFWPYVGLAVVTRSTADQIVVKGVLQRNRRPVATRGLNRNHNHLLKRVFKQAATSACQSGPFADQYQALIKRGTDPALARLTIARKIAALTLSIWKRGELFQVERLKAAVT